MTVIQEPASAPARKPQLAILQPLRMRNFLFFWIGETFSRFGDEFQTIALSTLAISLTGKASTLASILTVQNAPATLLLLYGGVIVDRFGARRVMIAANVALGLVVAGLVLASAAGPLTISHLYVYAILVGVARSFFQPASFSMPPTLVDRARLPAANSLHRMGLDISRFGAAPLAGALVAGWGVAPAFAFNAATFFQAAVMETFIRLPAPAQRKPEAAGVWAQLVSGLKIVRDDVVLRTAMLFTVLWYLGFMGAYHVGVAGFAQITLSAGPKGHGLMIAALGIGNLLGTAAAGSIRNYGKAGALAMISAAALAGSFALASTCRGVGLCSAILVIGGAANAFGYVALLSLAQSRSVAATRGRVMSVLMLAIFGVYPFSYALAGWVSELWGPRGVMLVSGGVLPLLAGVTAFGVREFRNTKIDMR